MIGGVRLWGQIGTFVLSIACLVIAVWPSAEGRWKNLRALIRFIPFWLGLFVSAYIIVQAVNVSWSFDLGTDGRLHPFARDSIGWLPTGVATPWRMMNPWRMFLIFAPCWLTTCAIWCGCRRPKAMRYLLWVIAINGCLFAGVGILQSVTHAGKMLWFFEKPVRTQTFWGLIVNPNHASAFMNLGLAAALTLFLHYTGRQGRDFTKGGAYLMLLPTSAVMGIGIFQAMSRAGIIVTVLIVLSFLSILALRLFRYLREDGNKALIVVFCSALLVLLGVAVTGMKSAVNKIELEREIRSLFAVANDPEGDTRFFVNEASWDLFRKRPAYGWGAGCYRYFINLTQRNYPELNRRNVRLQIVYAHNDYMNSLCDLGIVGSVPIFATLLALPLFVLLFRRRGVDGAFLTGLAGIAAVMLHAALEFFMQHPLVALQFAIFFAVLTRMACLNHTKAKNAEISI